MKTNSVKIYKNQLHSYTIIVNYPEREIKKTKSFKIAPKRILRNKFKQGGERSVH